MLLLWRTTDRANGHSISFRYLTAFRLPAVTCCDMSMGYSRPNQDASATVCHPAYDTRSLVRRHTRWRPSALWFRKRYSCQSTLGATRAEICFPQSFSDSLRRMMIYWTNCLICNGCGWSGVIFEMENPDLVVLSKSRHMRSWIVWAVCCRAKFLKSTSHTAHRVTVESPCHGPDGYMLALSMPMVFL